MGHALPLLWISDLLQELPPQNAQSTSANFVTLLTPPPPCPYELGGSLPGSLSHPSTLSCTETILAKVILFLGVLCWSLLLMCPPVPSSGSEYDCYSVNGDIEGDNQNELDKSSTIPRNSSIAQNYRRMIQTKRPASTAGLPIGTALPTGTPGVATIRRTPSTKPTVRRTVSSTGPIPIRPPIVPVKTPTVPDSPSHASPLRMGSDECVFYADDACSPHGLDFTKASPKRLSLPNASWGSNALEISVYARAGKPSTEEEEQLAANRHSLVEKIGELVASAHALGDGQFPFPTVLSDSGPGEQTPNAPPAASSEPPTEDMLIAIRRGVRLRRTLTNDRSAPRFL